MMIISLIIKFSKTFNSFDLWIKKFIKAYEAQLPKEISVIPTKENLYELCRKDLENILTYQKLGAASGFPKPRIIPKPK